MRFVITSFVVLLGLLFSTASLAGGHEASEGGAETTPPVEASPPGDGSASSAEATGAGEGETDEAAETTEDPDAND